MVCGIIQTVTKKNIFTYYKNSFIALIMLTDAALTPRCNVKDSIARNPNMPRAPPAKGFHFKTSTETRLKWRLGSGDKNAFAALYNKNMQCQEDYVIPVAWHVLHSTDGTGNVTMQTLHQQTKVLNGEVSMLKYTYGSSVRTILGRLIGEFFSNCFI